MDAIEHLLTCTGEESAEVAEAAVELGRLIHEITLKALAVQKATSKAMRFSLADMHPQRGESAARVLAAELNDLTALVELLQARGVKLPGLGNRDEIEAKKAKVTSWMQHAVAMGALTKVGA